jgi:hypothetical protein
MTTHGGIPNATQAEHNSHDNHALYPFLLAAGDLAAGGALFKFVYGPLGGVLCCLGVLVLSYWLFQWASGMDHVGKLSPG